MLHGSLFHPPVVLLLYYMGSLKVSNEDFFFVSMILIDFCRESKF